MDMHIFICVVFSLYVESTYVYVVYNLWSNLSGMCYKYIALHCTLTVPWLWVCLKAVVKIKMEVQVAANREGTYL